MTAVGGEVAAVAVRDTSWHGPASVAGAVVGSLAALLLLPFTVALSGDAQVVNYVLPWTLGLPMLLGRGAVRRFGVGLLASGLLMPAVSGAFLLALWL